jgi:hypothetical protein
MLRYINSRVCAGGGSAQAALSSASFYYILRECGSALAHYWCNAPKIP